MISRTSGWADSWLLHRFGWQLDGKLRTDPDLAFGANHPPEALDDGTDDEEPEPEPTVLACRHRALEPVENVRQPLGWNANAPVLDDKAGGSRRPLDGHVDGLSWTKLGGIGNQIGYDLLEAQPIPLSDHRCFWGA